MFLVKNGKNVEKWPNTKWSVINNFIVSDSIIKNVKCTSDNIPINI